MDREQLELGQTYYRTQAGSSLAVAQIISGLWSQIDRTDLDGSWASIREQVALAVAAGQVRSAAAPALVIEQMLALEGLTAAPLETLNPLAFAGWTAAGLELAPVLDSTPIAAKTAIATGSTTQQASALALSRLLMIATTEVQDAGRGAMDAGMRLERQIVGYIRVVKTPACGRCLILSGKFFDKQTQFKRHPRCDCQTLPTTSRVRPETDPRDLFDQMSREQQDAAFTVDGAKAVREGADPSQVMNARYSGSRRTAGGMSTPGDRFTTSGTTVRGSFGRAQRAAGRDLEKKQGARYRSAVRQRLSPQGIALEAGDDLAKYRRLLLQNGYV